MSNACLSAADPDPIVMRNRTGEMTICKPIDLDIAAGSGGMTPCIVSGLSRLTPSEVAALPKRMRP